MAHNTLLRADLAAWNVALPVTPGEFWGLDENVFKSVNGDDGGTWTPAAAIVIGGSGIELTGAANRIAGGAVLEVDGSITSDAAFSPPRVEFIGSTGDLNINSGGDLNIVGGELYLTTAGTAWLYSGTTVHADGNVGFGATAAVNYENGSVTNFNNGSALAILSGCTFTVPGTMAVTGSGSVTLANGTSLTGALGSSIQFAAGSTSNFYGATTLSGTVAFGAATAVTTAASTTLTIDGVMSTGTSGHFSERIEVFPNANTTVYASSLSPRTYLTRGLSANRTATLSAIGNVDGGKVTFIATDTLYYVELSALYLPAGTSTTTFRIRNASGYAYSVTLVYSATLAAWVLESAFLIP
jgi:hypothetical protein